MNKRDLLIFRIVTGLLSALVILGASQYFFNHEMVEGMFQKLQFPTYLIYPMGIAKILGIIALWTKIPKTIKEWAYAGFTFNFLLGISAHININDGEFMGALIALILLLISYFYYKKLDNHSEKKSL